MYIYIYNYIYIYRFLQIGPWMMHILQEASISFLKIPMNGCCWVVVLSVYGLCEDHKGTLPGPSHPPTLKAWKTRQDTVRHQSHTYQAKLSQFLQMASHGAWLSPVVPGCPRSDPRICSWPLLASCWRPLWALRQGAHWEGNEDVKGIESTLNRL